MFFRAVHDRPLLLIIQVRRSSKSPLVFPMRSKPLSSLGFFFFLIRFVPISLAIRRRRSPVRWRAGFPFGLFFRQRNERAEPSDLGSTRSFYRISGAKGREKHSSRSTAGSIHHRTISRVPAPIRTQPIRDFVLNSSCRKTNANTSVMTTLSLSIGTTFDASPICSAL